VRSCCATAGWTFSNGERPSTFVLSSSLPPWLTAWLPTLPRTSPDYNELTPFYQIFEKSRFSTETGAALVLSSNGTRVLSRLGFSFSRARGRKITAWDTLDGSTLANIGSLDLLGAEERFGAPLMSVHRVDLHKELLQLAGTEDEGGEVVSGKEGSVKLRLNARVVSVDVMAGSVELADGELQEADLVIAADGVHSLLRDAVVGKDGTTKAETTGLSAFRFLIPTEELKGDAELRDFLKWKCMGPTILADTREMERERHMVWYDCQE